MQKLSRRDFAQGLLGSVLTVSLVEKLCQAKALTGSVKPVIYRWLVELYEMSRDLKQQQISPLAWQNKVNDLFARVERADLLRAINFDQLAKRVRWDDNYEYVEDIKLPRVEGLPKDLLFTVMLVALRKDRPIVPHGHSNMATMHLILSGDVHLRQYDRVKDEPKHLVIKPTVDKVCKAGELSTISDEKNNVHWFKPESETAFAFNVGVYAINPEKSFTGREYIDPEGGEKVAGEFLRVRRIEQEEAYRLYSRA